MKRLLKLWPLLLLLMAVLVSLFLRQRLKKGSTTEELTRTYAAQRGRLTAVVSVTGEVYAPRQVSLAFDVNKTELIELNVKAGQQVKAGDVLARIDTTALEYAVTQAEAALTAAQDALAQVRAPYSELELTQARLAVEQAKMDLEDAKQKLEEVQKPASELELAEARLAVAQAEIDLKEAEKKLAEAQEPATELELAEARLAVTQAEIALEEAKANLQALLNPDIASAEAAVQEANANLKNARNQLAIVENSTDNAAKLRTLEAEAEWYRNNYWAAQKKFERGEIDQQKLNWEYSNMLAAEERLKVARLQAESAIASAKSKVAEAEKALREAQDRLATLKRGPDTLSLTRAKSQVAQAEYNLAKAQQNLAKLEAGPDTSELARLELQVTQAKHNLIKAQEKLATLEAKPNATEVAKARLTVAQAEYNLTKAQERLAELEAGPDPKEVQAAEAKVASAQVTLQEAQAALKAATMVAPFDGTIISVGAEVGDLVSANTVIVVLADLSELRVRAIIDETDIAKIESGQQAQITFDAFPGRRFKGQVLEVPLQGQLSQNVVTYGVPLSLEGAAGIGLKPGMTANVNIIVGQRENALLIPVVAVQQDDEGFFVMVQNAPDQPASATPVEIGLSDGVYVEVLRGLLEGDLVQATYQTSQRQTRAPTSAGVIRLDVPTGPRR